MALKTNSMRGDNFRSHAISKVWVCVWLSSCHMGIVFKVNSEDERLVCCELCLIRQIKLRRFFQDTAHQSKWVPSTTQQDHTTSSEPMCSTAFLCPNFCCFCCCIICNIIRCVSRWSKSGYDVISCWAGNKGGIWRHILWWLTWGLGCPVTRQVSSSVSPSLMV